MRALIEQWDQPLPRAYVPNPEVRERLLAEVRQPGGVAELIGGVGTGKTTLLKSISQDGGSPFKGLVEYFVGSPAFKLSDAVESIAQQFRTSTRHHLFVVDEAHQLDTADILEGLARLSTGPSQFSTILSSQHPLGVGVPVILAPMAFEALARLIEAEVGLHLPPEVVQRLWAVSQGFPQAAKILANEWGSGRVSTVGQLSDLLSPFAAPGLVDARGRPLRPDSHEEKQIISDVRFVSEELLSAVAKDPDLVHALTPREFEQLSAELFERQGYQVTLTQQSRDGGKDLYLAKANGLGSFLFIVECKRYAPTNPVDVGVVRALYGVAQVERATAAITLTTSYFTHAAKQFAEQVRYQLFLNDFFTLKKLLAPYR